MPLPITGTGDETRDFTFVLDLVQGLVKSGYYEKAVGQNFNLGAGREMKIIELAKLVNEVTGNNAGIIFKRRRKWDTKPRLLACIKKAEELIGYKPCVDFEHGIMENIEWFRDNWERIDEFKIEFRLDYFIENNLSIYLDISNQAYKSWPTDVSISYDGAIHSLYNYNKEKNWNVGIGLNYYFIRGIY